jgi:subtilisin family serine protease
MKLKHILFSFSLSLLMLGAVAQEAPENWFNLDLEKDSVLGVSTERAYNEVLKGRESKKIIVAVIDDGIDYKHEDLKDVIWVNKDEIPNNGKDDDNNGYVDDVHGWNFIGGKNGNVKDDTYEVTRLFRQYSAKYEEVDLDTLTKEEKAEYKLYTEEVKIEFLEKFYEAANSYLRIKEIMDAIDKIEKDLDGKVTQENLKEYKPESKIEELAIKNMVAFMGYGMSMEDLKGQFEGAIGHYKEQTQVAFNTNFYNRDIVGDNYNDPTERNYGNNDYRGPNGDHGSHVAGIIGAVRSNTIGIKGVADNIEIMILRVVPNGDERDKDVANGIRYAVDNGASVINMSFGKKYSPYKSVVDEAVKYAAEKDVLLVHGSGNDAVDIDIITHYPTDNYLKKGKAKNWIEVGASDWKLNNKLTASFSNYGAKNVDLFAPGVQVNSTVPDDEYAAFSGTSMASPVTAGVAALIRSYFPTLTAEQVKEILMKTVTKVDIEVRKPGTKDNVKLSKLCVTGGIVNAYKAAQLAAKTKGKKK